MVTNLKDVKLILQIRDKQERYSFLKKKYIGISESAMFLLFPEYKNWNSFRAFCRKMKMEEVKNGSVKA